MEMEVVFGGRNEERTEEGDATEGVAGIGGAAAGRRCSGGWERARRRRAEVEKMKTGEGGDGVRWWRKRSVEKEEIAEDEMGGGGDRWLRLEEVGGGSPELAGAAGAWRR
jgi:hypothetical protein